MKYCKYCGTEIADEVKFCPNCGKSCTRNIEDYTSVKVDDPNQSINTLALVFGFISVGITVFAAMLMFLMLLLTLTTTSVAFAGFLIFLLMCAIPLAWMIPLTIHLKKSLDNKRSISVAFKVCYLIFVSLVSGILLLCRDESVYL